MPDAPSESSMVIAIAGAGPVGMALGKTLIESGAPVKFVGSRDPEHAAAAAAFMGSGVGACRYVDIPLLATHVLVAVSDSAISEVAESLTSANGRLRVALHTSGNFGPEALAPLRLRGVPCGSLHPLQTIPEPERGALALRSAAFGICGDTEAATWARDLAKVLSGKTLEIAPASRPHYHAAAVMASNYLVALIDCAEHLMSLAGVTPDEARSALAPLVRASVENALSRSPVAVLTGPVVRGDAITVADHVGALRQAEPSVLGLYRAAGLHALQMARHRGLDASEAAAVERALLG